jgi:hypothetical protein
MDETILLAKRHLYSLLLKKGVDNLTDSEIDMMYAFSKDEQIQNFLNEKLKDENQNN